MNSLTSTHTTLRVIDNETWTLRRFWCVLVLSALLLSCALTTGVILANYSLRAKLYQAQQVEYNFQALKERIERQSDILVTQEKWLAQCRR